MGRTIYEYLITPDGDRYNNVKISNGRELILNATIDEKDFKFTNRIGVITAIPRKQGNLEVGDKVIVHHNTFRRWYNVRGKLKDSSNLIKEDQFSCDLDMIFAYNKGDGWIALEDYCFIKPIPKVDNGFYTGELYEERVGTVWINNPILEAQGIKVGDKIGFRKNAEYKFEIDGEIVYKMSAARSVKYSYELREDKKRETAEA